jgi:hypothetical protein
MSTTTDQLLEDLADKVDALTAAKAAVANLQIEVAQAAARLVVGTCVLPPLPAAPTPPAVPPALSSPAPPVVPSALCGKHHPALREMPCALETGHGGQHANEEGDVFWGGPKPGSKSPQRGARAKPKKLAKGARKRPRASARLRRRAPSAPPAKPTPKPQVARAVEPASSPLFGGARAGGGEPPTIRQAILDLIAERGPMTSADVMQALGGNPNSTRRKLYALEVAGELVREEQGSGLLSLPDEASR